MRALALPRLADVPSLRALRHPAYLAVWTGAFISNLGTWMETVALGIHVTRTTGQAAWTGGVVALTYLPALFLAPLGGALADRMDRRAYLLRVTVTQSVLAFLLALLAFTGHLSVPAVALLSFANGCALMLLGPAFNALLAELVPNEDLLSALALSSAQFNLGRILGPALATAVIAWGGVAWALVFNAISFVAVMVALQARAGAPLHSAPSTPPPLWRGVREGLLAVRADTTLQAGMWLVCAVALFVAPFIGLLPAYSLKVLGGSDADTGLLVSAQGVGAVAAALLVGSITARLGPGRTLSWGTLAIAPVAALFWMAPTLRLATLALVPLGALYFLLVNGVHALCQGRVPRALQGRVSSLLSASLSGTYAAGVAMQGWLGDRVGLRSTAVGAAFLFAALVLSAGRKVLRPLWRATPAA